MISRILQCLTALSLIAGLSTPSTLMARTCPERIKQDSQGYWVSNNPPKWKSHNPTKGGIWVKTEHFAGSVYSPSKKRVACVYRPTDKQWVIMWSNIKHPISGDNLIGSAWEYNHQHKDFVCGKPKHSLSDCQFKL